MGSGFSEPGESHDLPGLALGMAPVVKHSPSTRKDLGFQSPVPLPPKTICQADHYEPFLLNHRGSIAQRNRCVQVVTSVKTLWRFPLSAMLRRE
jgi:hypothetical protein